MHLMYILALLKSECESNLLSGQIMF